MKNKRGQIGFGRPMPSTAAEAAVVMLEEKLGRRLLSGKVALSTCDNPDCVNPSHLFEGEPAVLV